MLQKLQFSSLEILKFFVTKFNAVYKGVWIFFWNSLILADTLQFHCDIAVLVPWQIW